jgi:uncharacterized heparinase superfamily protein
MTGPASFVFLNEEGTLAKGWDAPAQSKLWRYNLHYFDDLNSDTAAEKQDWHRALITRWIAENPPGVGSGWEPYPTSLRVVNWIKWSFVGTGLEEAWDHSLGVQVRYLVKRLEHHLLGNHLFANAKALVFAGLFFAGREAEDWLQKGLRILNHEIPEQILPDGGHFERSPMYHAIILEDMLDLVNMLRAFGQEVPAAWVAATEKMLDWLAGMTHPDGDIVLFNDAAFGIAALPEQLFDYAGRLGLRSPRHVAEGLCHFAASGYIRLQHGPATAFLDVAPIGPDYLPGHAHADTLTFELSLGQQRVIVDSGISCYGVSGERLRQRGTAAHNSVVVNGADSSEVWSGFRVARRARPRDLQVSTVPGQTSVACSHTGYRRLPGRPVHRRQWQLTAEELRITDRIIGPYQAAMARLHLHPDLDLLLGDHDNAGRIILPDGAEIVLQVSGGRCAVTETTYHPEFGLSLKNRCLEVHFLGNEIEIRLIW